MRRTALLAFVLIAVATLAGTAGAEEHDGEHEFPEHAHILLLGAEITTWPPGPGFAITSVRKCVDLAANQKLPLGSQHHNVHFGTAGEMLRTKAGHLVAPAAGFPDIPWTDCASFLTIWGLD